MMVFCIVTLEIFTTLLPLLLLLCHGVFQTVDSIRSIFP